MGLTSEEIATIVPAESSAFVSERSSHAFNDASAMPSADHGLSPMEIAAHTSDISAVPLNEHESNAPPHRLLLASSPTLSFSRLIPPRLSFCFQLLQLEHVLALPPLRHPLRPSQKRARSRVAVYAPGASFRTCVLSPPILPILPCSALISSVMRKSRPHPTAVRGKVHILGCSVS